MTAFRVRGFASGRHPDQIPFGTLLLETSHTTETSAYVEIEAWKERMKRGEVSRVELVDQRVGGTLTNLDVQPHTDIPWSWRKK